MKQEIPKEVLAVFTTYEPALPDHAAGEIQVETVGGGLINHSYKISSGFKSGFLLQQINKNVFTDPRDVQENYIRIWQYAEFEFTGLRLPSPKYCGKMTTLFMDRNQNFWRAFEFIENARTIPVAEIPAQATATAGAFAKFTLTFSEFNVQLLKNIIPGFHDLSLRYRQFEEAMEGEYYERMAMALPLINELKQKEKYIHFYESITGSGEFPQRVMHHDAKIANILFNRKTGKVICPVDFDTVMPGYFFSDLGDMIRSMVSPEEEDSTRYDKIVVRKEFYDAVLEGYLAVMEEELTSSEKKYIHYAGLLMTYMQALRFLTDYLNGDVYYRTSRPEQNLDRAKNQSVLLQKLEEFLSKQYNFRHD
ncbi:MAG: phosphotransferase [Bacteroidota bacterium]